MRKPYKFGAVKRAAFLDALRQGARRGAAAESVGVGRDTVRQVMNEEPDFAAAVDQAEMEANELVEDALFQAANSGNVIACQVWLYNRQPDRWQDKRQVNSDIKSTVTQDISINEGLKKVYDEPDDSTGQD